MQDFLQIPEPSSLNGLPVVVKKDLRPHVRDIHILDDSYRVHALLYIYIYI